MLLLAHRLKRLHRDVVPWPRQSRLSLPWYIVLFQIEEKEGKAIFSLS
jgi:hypothetical protein